MRHFAIPLLFLALVCPAQTRQPAPPDPDNGAARPKGKRELKMFYLFTASFADVKTVAGEFLSPEGTISYLQSKNAAVVIDYPANLKNITEVIEALEGEDPPANIRIKVTFDEVSEAGQKGWEIDPGWPIVVEDGKITNDRIDISGKRERGSGSEQTTQEILTRAGAEARIWVGETVQEPLWVYEYGRRRAWWQTEFEEYNFGASLWVRPRLLNNGLVEIEIFPRITSRTGKRRSIEVKELAVSVYARDGQTVHIGGMDRQKREAYGRILGRKSIFNGATLAITLTPRIEHLDKVPSPGTVREPATPITVDRTYRKLD